MWHNIQKSYDLHLNGYTLLWLSSRNRYTYDGVHVCLLHAAMFVCVNLTSLTRHLIMTFVV